MKSMTCYAIVCFNFMAGMLLVESTVQGRDQAIFERIRAVNTNNSTPALAALGSDVESLKADDPALYFQASDRLGAALEPLASTNVRCLHELERLCESALAVRSPTNSGAMSVCITSKLEIANRMDRAFPESVERIRILAGFLGELRTIMITNYEFVPHSMSCVPVPILATNSNSVPQFHYAGMNPKIVKDPRFRAAYEQAIVENERRGQQDMADYNLQTHAIPEANYALTELFVKYAKRLFAHEPITMDEAGSLAKLAHLTAEEEALMRSPAPSPNRMWYMQHSPH